MAEQFISEGSHAGQTGSSGGDAACHPRRVAAVPGRRIISGPTPSRLIGVLLLAQLFVIGAAGASVACDPLAFDFDAYLSEQDRDRDNRLSRAELLAGPDGIAQSYGATLDRAVNTDAAFDYLDSNRDGLLDSDELWKWGEFTHNACAGWPWDEPGEG